MRGTWYKGKLLTENDPAILSGNVNNGKSNSSKQNKLYELFNEYDKNNVGFITKDDFVHLTLTQSLVSNKTES